MIKNTTIDFVEDSNMNEMHTDNLSRKMSSWILEPRKKSENFGTI